MTEVGIVHLLSALYLAVIISLALSVNQNRDPRRIMRETFRRLRKFLLIGTGVGLAIALIVRFFA